MAIQEIYYILCILMVLFGLGTGWGFVRTRLKTLEENCRVNRENCLMRIAEHNRSLESEINEIKNSINQMNITLQNFMLTMNEWKGVVTQQIADNTKSINGLKKKYNKE